MSFWIGILCGLGLAVLTVLCCVVRFLAWVGDQDHLAPGYSGAEDDTGAQL